MTAYVDPTDPLTIYTEQTCEDRDWRCCDAMPPDPDQTWEEYTEWYVRHVAAWEAG